MSKFTSMLNNLNCMNYHVENNEGFFYLQDGIRSLWRLSKHNNIPFKTLLKGLVSPNKQVMFKDFDGNGDYLLITMI